MDVEWTIQQKNASLAERVPISQSRVAAVVAVEKQVHELAKTSFEAITKLVESKVEDFVRFD
jgi:hypothetical protein